MKLLVTGSAGTVGRYVCRELKARDHVVHGFDRKPTADIDASIEGDIADAQAVHDAIDGVDIVVHLAAYPTGTKDFVGTLMPANIVGVHNVMEGAKAHGVQRVVLCSTTQVVSGLMSKERTSPIRADEVPAPLNHYAATKVFAESLATQYSRTAEMSCIVVRPGWLPRSKEEVERMRQHRHVEKWFVSPGDLARWFACAVEADAGLKHAIVFGVGYAGEDAYVDIVSACELIGYEPQDGFLEGVDDLPDTDWVTDLHTKQR